ncbi:hypothetical protein ACFV6M_24620, partial [Streptomyces californicus]
MSTTSPTVRRELSPLERWYWIADQISPLNVVGRVRLHGPVSRAALRTALDGLQARGGRAGGGGGGARPAGGGPAAGGRRPRAPPARRP